MNKKYVVRLSDEERGVCQEIIKNLKGSSQKFRRAQIPAQGGCRWAGWPDQDRRGFNCRVQTIENLRKRLVTEGFAWALEGKKRQEPPTPCKLDGEEAEAKLIAMRLGKPPAGYGHWTLQLLADEMVALEVVDSISHETVRKTLKKMA